MWEFLALLSASLLTEVVVLCYKSLTNCLQVLKKNFVKLAGHTFYVSCAVHTKSYPFKVSVAAVVESVAQTVEVRPKDVAELRL